MAKFSYMAMPHWGLAGEDLHSIGFSFRSNPGGTPNVLTFLSVRAALLHCNMHAGRLTSAHSWRVRMVNLELCIMLKPSWLCTVLVRGGEVEAAWCFAPCSNG